MKACILTGFPFYIDFDEDDVISGKDLREVINRLTGEQALNDEEMEQLIQNVRKRGKKMTCICLSMHFSVLCVVYRFF